MEGTMVYHQTSFNPGKLLFFLMVITLIITGGLRLSHGVSKHHEDAEVARACIDSKGADLVYQKEIENRRVQLCMTPLGLGIRVMELIDGKWEELTSFLNRNITTIEEMISFAECDKTTYGLFTYVRMEIKNILMYTFGS
jgi:hypothetical protein